MTYFEWLCNLVHAGNEYIELLSILDEFDYIWYIVLDENREKGGLALRDRYAREAGIYSSDCRTGNCTFLEMLIALSELMACQIDGSDSATCFWLMIDNLMLRNVDNYGAHIIVLNFLNNNYTNTRNSLFPLRNYCGDIRALDLYSQMNAWLEENFPHQNIF